jgi:hypothetical protein
MIQYKHTSIQFGISFNRAVFMLLVNTHLLGFLLRLLASFQILGNWKYGIVATRRHGKRWGWSQTIGGEVGVGAKF